MPCSRCPFGLSLVELIVAIFLIGLLSALLLVGVNLAVQRVGSVTAAANLRSMGAALFTHVAENDYHLIDGAMGPSLAAGELSSQAGPSVAFWFNALDYYLGGTDYTLEGMRDPNRPSWQHDPLKKYSDNLTGIAGYSVSIGYGWNHQFFGYDRNNIPDRGWRSTMLEVPKPAETIIIGTGEDSLNENNPLRNIMIYANSIRCRRHSGGGYYLFLDGHIEHLTPEEVMADNSYLMRRNK